MGLCRYCDRDAGFLKSVHQECKQAEEDRVYDEQFARTDAENKLRQIITKAITDDLSVAEVIPLVEAERERGKVPTNAAADLMLDAANRACFSVAMQEPIGTGRISRIFDLFEAIQPNSLNPQNVGQQKGYCAVSLSQVVHEVLHGTVPYWNPSAQVGFILRPGETPIVKRTAILMEHKTFRAPGSYQSVSVPIGGGMYYRIAASTPGSQQSGLVETDRGTLMVTTQATYFGGAEQTFRIDHEDILRLEPFRDAIGIHPQYGKGMVLLPGTIGFDDGWFWYNLLSALAAGVLRSA